MKTLVWKSLAAGVALYLTASFGACGDILYNNSATDTGNSLDLLNDEMLGNEIIMGNASPFDSVSSFSFEIYSPESSFIGANVQMEVYLLPNTGTSFNGYPTPNTATPLYDSGLFALQTPQQQEGEVVGTINVNLSLAPVTVPRDFTLAVEVTGLDAADSVGVELFDPPTTGSSYEDYWLNNGGWGLYTNSTGTAFATRFVGTPTPEPSALTLGAAGATIMLLGAFAVGRRRANAVRQ
jgi:hypothetical protein